MNMNFDLTRTIQAAIFLVVSIVFFHVSADELADSSVYGVIELEEAIATLPESSQKIIHDKRLLDEENRGVRVFRLYKPVPAHYH